LVDPNVPSGDPNNISNVELYDPNVSAPNVSAPNVSAPNVSAPNVSAPNVSAPNVSAPNVSAPNVSAPNVSAPNVSAYGVVNPNVSAPNVSAPNVSAAPPQSDGTYTVTNNRNTNASYNVAVIGQSSTRLQLLLSQIYMTPQTDGQCGLIAQQQNITLANVPNTPITPPDQLSSLTTPNVSAVPVTSPSFSLGPHDTAYITLRGNVDVATMKQILTKVAPAIIPQGIKSNDTTSTTPSIVAPLFITTATLPNGVVGQPYNPPSGAQLQAIGGTLGTGECSGYFWNWSAASDSAIPPGLTISNRGLISGTPTAPGTYNALVHVSTCIRGEVATRVLSIRVLAPLAITTTSLPTATQGIGNGPVTFVASGGTGSYNWTPVTVDGMSLNSSGVLSGTPTTTGTFPFTATVSDNGPPVQTVSQLITLTVVPATPAPPTGSSTLLFDNFNAAGVTQSANGPTSPTAFTLPSTSVITQMATYHWNGGAGATPGTIGLQLQLPAGVVPIFGPFPTVGVTGQNNVANAAWVTSPNPNVIVPAGTYTVLDSSPATWSFNSGSNNAGFTRVWGFAVQVSALSFVTQPTNTTASQSISPSVQVKATDSSGAALPFIAITISIGSNPSGGTLSGTLTQTTDATGIATFSNLSIDKAGSGYTLLASSTSTITASSQFSITNPCAAFPAGVVPFTTLYYVTRDSAGDAFIVGGLVGGTTQVLQSVPLPNQLNQQFCNPVTLETNYTVPAYVPTAAERVGDFTAYAGLALVDPANGAPFPTPNVIPANRLGSVFAWRIPPHSSTLPRLSCSLEPTLHSIEAPVPTSIQFTNKTSGPVNVYWINYQGQRVFYRGGQFPPLAAGQSYVQGTFITHPWIVTDATSNACLGIWLPTESPDTAAITGVAISSVNLNSTTLTIGGANVPYSATLSNATGATVSNLLVQAYIDQGAASRAAGGAVITCITTMGDLPPGSCIFNFSVVASNSNAGNGTLVPGTANARFELRGPNGLLDVFTVPVTLAGAPSAGSRYLVVADGRSSPSSIFRIVPDGSSTALVATLATGRAIAVSIDPTTNTLYSADPFHAEVWKVSLWGGAVLPLFAGSPLANPVAVTVDSAGNVYVGDNSTDAVYKITPAGALTLFANLPASPNNLQDIRMAFDASGNLVVGSDFVGNVANVSEIDQISPAGVSTTVYNSASMNGGTAIKEIGGLAIDASGNIIVADYASSSIVKIANPGTSNMTATTLITDASLGGNTAITGLTVVDSAAGIYDVTANFANKILSVNTSTNAITTLVSGPPLTYPTDIAISGLIPSPQPATNVTPVVNFSAPSVTLNWTASTSAVNSYNIYRKRTPSSGPPGAFMKIASVSANSPNPTSYTDTAVAFGDSLDYYVTSVDSNNVESVPSNVVHTGIA
jgi:hypothetical protein